MQCIRQNGFEPIELPHLSAETPEKSLRILRETLTSCSGPLGLYTCYDDYGQSIIRLATQHGIRVPEDLAILGGDDDPLVCDFCEVPLSSIPLNHFEQGYRAAELLDELLQGRSQDVADCFIPPGRVVERRSTDTIAASDPIVRAVLLHVRNHLQDTHTIASLANRVQMPPRTLQLRFSKEFGCGINEAIIRLRLQEVYRLLENTASTGKAIAHTTGFRDPYYLYRVFKQRTGMTMKQWRNAHQ